MIYTIDLQVFIFHPEQNHTLPGLCRIYFTSFLYLSLFIFGIRYYIRTCNMLYQTSVVVILPIHTLLMLLHPLVLILLATGFLFLVSGWLLKKWPPKKINILCGYRTARSLRNKESWDFAQKMAATEALKCGAILSIASAIGLFWHPAISIAAMVSLGFILAVSIFFFLRIESALKNKFES